MIKKILATGVLSLSLLSSPAQAAGAYYTIALVTTLPDGTDLGAVVTHSTVTYSGKFATYLACQQQLKSIVRQVGGRIREGFPSEWYSQDFDIGTSAYCVMP